VKLWESTYSQESTYSKVLDKNKIDRQGIKIEKARRVYSQMARVDGVRVELEMEEGRNRGRICEKVAFVSCKSCLKNIFQKDH